MKRYMALLLAGLVAACGGDGGDGTGQPTNPCCGLLPGGPNEVVQESNAAVALSPEWSATDSRWGWSGGSAVQSSTAGAKATLSFSGSAVRWIGARGRGMGKAKVSVDGGTPTEVDLIGNTADEVRTNVITISGLSDGAHTLTVEVVSGTVVVDAFEVNPKTTVSHLQESDPNATFSGGWLQASTDNPWSGSGAAPDPNPSLTAREAYTAGETATLSFRGTAVSWIGYKGPDGGIATVQIDGAAPIEVDTYSSTVKLQEVLFTYDRLSDANHTLTITATGTKNAASSAARIVVDAFDVMTPGIRAEENHPSISWGGFWDRNAARVFSEGSAKRTSAAGASVIFTFNGTSVSWIGAKKSAGGGTANIFLDGNFVRTVTLRETYPTEAYQSTIFRVDGLSNGRHTLRIVAAGDGDVYVDAFDVHP